MTIRQSAPFELIERIVRVAGQNQPLMNELFGMLYAYKLATRTTIHRNDLVAFLKEWWIAKALGASSSTQLHAIDEAIHGAWDIFSVPNQQALQIVEYENGRVSKQIQSHRLHDAMHYCTLNDLMLGLRDVYESKQDRMIISERGIQIYTAFYRAN